MSYEVVIVGGSFAGLSAAMQLARARRRILLVDAGEPRNRLAKASHGFLGQDGVAPAQIMREGLRQLRAYPTVDFHHGRAMRAEGERDAFQVALDDGTAVEGRRLILAHGVADTLPEVPGLAERWGRTVVHCPFCHGYEFGGGPLGVLATGPLGAHQAEMLPDWGPTTLFTQGLFVPEPEVQARLDRRGVTVETTPVVALLGEAPALEAVRLADGRVRPLAGLFTAPRTTPNGDLAQALGCAFEEGPMGPHIAADGRQETTVPGVFAAGDAARAMHNATLASASGVMAGVGAYQSLLA